MDVIKCLCVCIYTLIYVPMPIYAPSGVISKHSGAVINSALHITFPLVMSVATSVLSILQLTRRSDWVSMIASSALTLSQSKHASLFLFIIFKPSISKITVVEDRRNHAKNIYTNTCYTALMGLISKQDNSKAMWISL